MFPQPSDPIALAQVRVRAASSRARRATRSVVLGVLLLALSGCNPAFRIALLGDVPYSDSTKPAYDRLIADVNRDGVAFSSHVGDFKARSSICTDAEVNENIVRFDTFANPLVYTPGDNDWTDCSDSRTRLARLRTLVFRSTGADSRGRSTMPLTSQSDLGYPENAQWTRGPVTFATVHVVGSSDNQADPTEQSARRLADIDWVRDVFAGAKTRGDKGVVLIAHTHLRFSSAEGAKGIYESMFQAVRAETMSFAGQVLYVHGDDHTFIDDQPMRSASNQVVTNFRRVEVYGNPTVRWVRLTVAPDTNTLFSITTPPAP